MDLLRNAAGSSKQDSTLVKLQPTAGFVIKSVVAEPGYYVSSPEHLSTEASPTNAAGVNKSRVIPRGQKVFLNIAWDLVVPPPPTADEATIRRAMAGADLDDDGGSESYFVPVVVSEPREDKDKAGKPSLVFDCIFNISLKSRCTKDPEFKMYILELAMEHVEAKANMQLSRQIGTPNIASKGKLEPRMASIPNALLDPSQWSLSTQKTQSPARKKALIADSRALQSVREPPVVDKPKSILKQTPTSTSATRTPMIQEIVTDSAILGESDASPDSEGNDAAANLPPPRWKWTQDRDILKVEIEVPKLTRELCAVSTLDIETRRIILHVPKHYYLDINLDVPDAAIARIETGSMDGDDQLIFKMDKNAMQVRGLNAGETLRLKRARDLDVDRARAQWLVNEHKIFICV